MPKFRQGFFGHSNHFRTLCLGSLLAFLGFDDGAQITMTLKIDKESDGQRTVIRLSGRLRLADLDEVKGQMEGGRLPTELDLDGVTLVDVEVVRFLNDCEQNGIEMIHCCPYIREWMLREKDRGK